MPVTLNPPPPAPVEPVTEILHDVAITDPYRWLEDQNSPRTRKWLEEQSAYTRSYLDAIPGRDRIRKRVEELLAVEVISEPWKVGDRYFYLKRTAHSQQPAIMMRDGESGEEVALVDPRDRDSTGVVAVSILNISSDGKLLAYGVRRGGEDAYSVEFLDTDRRDVLPDRLPHGLCSALAFSSGGSGFYYSHIPLAVARSARRSVCWHTFGTGLDKDPEIFFAGEDENLRLAVYPYADGQRLAYLVTWLHDPPFADLYVHDLFAHKSPQRIIERMEGVFCPFFVGSQIIALSNWKAPNFRVCAIDLDKPQVDNWRELIPESRLQIQCVGVVGGLIFIEYVEDLATRIEIFDLSGKNRGILPCPTKGTARLLGCQPESDTLFYKFESFTHAPAILTYHTPTGRSEIWAKTQVPFDPSSLEVSQVSYPSKDGTKIPMFLVSRKGHHHSGANPSFLTGYGGFGASKTPQFAAYATFLVERGVLLALANLRGGSELGAEWHLAGKRHNRQNAVEDFIAGGEWLLTNGYAAPGTLAIGGGSNAGLLVGAALTQRPDLFRAVICLGPLLDMLRYHKFDLADEWVDEYGSAEDAEDFRFLRAYSPYHRVQDGVAYPAVMLISGDADTRCNPMHARKMAARLQAATVSEHPILLDYRPEWGHMPVQPLTRRIDALTDRLAFICHELGVSI